MDNVALGNQHARDGTGDVRKDRNVGAVRLAALDNAVGIDPVRIGIGGGAEGGWLRGGLLRGDIRADKTEQQTNGRKHEPSRRPCRHSKR